MKRTKFFIVVFFLLLWLFVSNREYYLRHCIEEIKESQRRELLLKRTDLSLKFLKVHKDDPRLNFKEEYELFYQDTLYDIISERTVAIDSVIYKLLPDVREQNLLAALANGKPVAQEGSSAIDFEKKIITDISSLLNFHFDPDFLIKAIFHIYQENLFFSFYKALLLPPD